MNYTCDICGHEPQNFSFKHRRHIDTCPVCGKEICTECLMDMDSEDVLHLAERKEADQSLFIKCDKEGHMCPACFLDESR